MKFLAWTCCQNPQVVFGRWVFPKIGGFPPKSSICSPIFGNIQMFHDLCWDIYGNVLFFHGGFGTVDFCMFSGIWYIRPSVCVGSQRIIYEG